MSEITANHVRGLWKREYIKIPAEEPTFEDHETEVYWFQAEGLYADLRIPKLVAIGKHDSDLVRKCEGFAGVSSVENNTCTWQRFINLQGPLEGADIGVLKFADEGLYEIGLEDAYLELWTRVDVQGEVNGQTYRTESHETVVAIWSDSHFLIAIDAIGRLDNETVLKDTPGQIDYGTYCFGHIQKGEAIVSLSNRPSLFGQSILTGLATRDLKPEPALKAFAGDGDWVIT